MDMLLSPVDGCHGRLSYGLEWWSLQCQLSFIAELERTTQAVENSFERTAHIVGFSSSAWRAADLKGIPHHLALLAR
ncbi:MULTISPECIES: hypothetical protein [Cupriavidus]|uniref:hypothetical protein n=1 Tax=Cupriavidus sp. DF5525 TaxID=3160989 RepID=UPI0032DFECD0